MGCPASTAAGPVFVTSRSDRKARGPPGSTVRAIDARLLAGFGSTVVLVMMPSLTSTTPAGVRLVDSKDALKMAEAPAARLGIVHCRRMGPNTQLQPAGVLWTTMLSPL